MYIQAHHLWLKDQDARLRTGQAWYDKDQMQLASGPRVMGLRGGGCVSAAQISLLYFPARNPMASWVATTVGTSALSLGAYLPAPVPYRYR